MGFNLGSIGEKANQINGLEKKITSIAKNPMNLLSPTKFDPFSQSVLTKMKGRGDPVLSFDWTIELPKIGQTSLDPEYVEGADIPFMNFDERRVYRQGKYAKYPGAVINYDDLTLTFYGDVNNKAFSYIQNWVNFVSKDGDFGRPKGINGVGGYKQTISIIMKDPYGQEMIRFDYKNCWPKQVAPVKLNSDSSDRVTWEVTFSIEEIQVTGFNMDTITGSIMDLVSGTISSAMNAAKDFVLNQGSQALNSVTGAIKNSSMYAQAKSFASGAMDKVTNIFK